MGTWEVRKCEECDGETSLKRMFDLKIQNPFVCMIFWWFLILWPDGILSSLVLLIFDARTSTVLRVCVCVWRWFTKRAHVYKARSIMQHLPSCVTCVPSCVFDLKVQEKVLLTLACYFETTMECCLAKKKRCQGYLKVHRSSWALYLFGSGTLVH